MFFVARVDPLWAVACKEVFVVDKAGHLFQHRHTIFLGSTGVDGGFVDNDIAFLQGLADGFGGLDQGSEIRAFVLIDGGGHGDDVDVAIVQGGGISTEGQLSGAGQFDIVHLQGGIMAVVEGINTRLIDVKPYHCTVLAKFHR